MTGCGDALAALLILIGIGVSFPALGTFGGSLIALGAVAVLVASAWVTDWYRHRRLP